MARKQREEAPPERPAEEGAEDVEAHLLKESVGAGLAAAALLGGSAKAVTIPVEPSKASERAKATASQTYTGQRLAQRKAKPKAAPKAKASSKLRTTRGGGGGPSKAT